MYGTSSNHTSVPGDFSRILVASITVPVYARYLVIRGADWMPNSNGIRCLSSLSFGGARSQVDKRNSVSGQQLNQQFTTIEHNDVNQIIECYAAQNSGKNIVIYPYIFAIILKRL